MPGIQPASHIQRGMQSFMHPQGPLWGESRHSSNSQVPLSVTHTSKTCFGPSLQPRLSGPSGPEKCRGQGAATQTVRMYGKEAATPPSALSLAHISGPRLRPAVQIPNFQALLGSNGNLIL